MTLSIPSPRPTASAYELGYSAGKSGYSIFECPYSSTHHPYDYKDWMKGHADGIRDSRLNGYGCFVNTDYTMEARL